MTRQRRHPDWLKVEIPSGPICGHVRKILNEHNLNTVCDHARCPNQAECFGNGTATFLILGHNCTRNCRYCAINQTVPETVDPGEPEKIAGAVKALGLKYVVITSVTRDDLPDNGSGHFAQTVTAVRRDNPGAGIELLIPDLQGNRKDLETILASRPDVLGHNIETVRELFPRSGPWAITTEVSIC